MERKREHLLVHKCNSLSEREGGRERVVGEGWEGREIGGNVRE